MPASIPSLARLAAPGFFFITALLGCGRSDDVATVNGQGISRAELDRQVRVYRTVRPGAADDAATRGQVLDQLVKQALLVQEARAAGLDKDPALQQAIEAQRRGLREELQASIVGLQARLAALDQTVETKALIDALSQVRRPGITVTAQDLQAAYELRAQREALPPLGQIRDQVLEQVILDRLVEAARAKAAVQIRPDALR